MPYLQLSKMLFRNQIHQALLHPPCWHGQNIDPAVTMAVILCYVLIAFYWQHLWIVEDKKSKAVGHNVLCFPTLQVSLGDRKWFNKIFFQETWWKSCHLDSCQCILWTKSHAKLVSTFFITNKYKQSLLENFPNLSKIFKVGKETTMETFGSIYAYLPRMKKLLHVDVFPNIHWPSKFICGFHAEISLTMMKTLTSSFNVALKS